jgi:hypothetical protein
MLSAPSVVIRLAFEISKAILIPASLRGSVASAMIELAATVNKESIFLLVEIKRYPIHLHVGSSY